MQLNLDVSPAVFEQLKLQARKAGVSIETAAEQRLAELVTKANAADDSSKRWNFKGRPWAALSKAEISEAYKAAAADYPEGPDEFAWHDDDSQPVEDTN